MFRVRLKNLCTTDEKFSRKNKHKNTPILHLAGIGKALVYYSLKVQLVEMSLESWREFD